MPRSENTKRILIILAIILLFALLGYAIYRLQKAQGERAARETPVSGVSGGIVDRLFPTPPAESVGTPIPSPTSGLEQEVKAQRLFQLADFSVVSPIIAKDQSHVMFYRKDGGYLFTTDLRGDVKQKLSNLTVIGLTEAIWAPTRDRAGIFYLSEENIKSFLHIGTSTVVSLPVDIKGLSWSPDGKEFAYLVEEREQLNLMISDRVGKTKKIVFRTPVLDAHITWITPSQIAFQTAPSGSAPGYVFLYNRTNNSFTKLLGPLFGLTTLWSPDGTRVLAASTNALGKELRLAVYDAKGKIVLQLREKTLPEKCVWIDANHLDCAVPRDIPSSVFLPDMYLRGQFSPQDNLVAIDLEKKETTPLMEGGAFDMSDLRITNKKDVIIFTNRIDGTLWSYWLP